MPSSLHGLLIVNKPRGLTSRDIVNRATSWFPRSTRMGHTGTLDPLATGVLPLCINAATRLAEYVQEMPKTYRTVLALGVRSNTDDAEGTVEAIGVSEPPSKASINTALDSFIGIIDQIPPDFSAAKISGKRAYSLARSGGKVNLSPRQVTVFAIELLKYDFPLLHLEIKCGKGTYIRSLARDLGDYLGCGAIVNILERTRVGEFNVEDALELDADGAEAQSHILPLGAAVSHLPAVCLNSDEVHDLRQGKAVSIKSLAFAFNANMARVAIFDEANQLVAVAAADLNEKRLRPIKVLSLS